MLRPFYDYQQGFINHLYADIAYSSVTNQTTYSWRLAQQTTIFIEISKEFIINMALSTGVRKVEWKKYNIWTDMQSKKTMPFECWLLTTEFVWKKDTWQKNLIIFIRKCNFIKQVTQWRVAFTFRMTYDASSLPIVLMYCAMAPS